MNMVSQNFQGRQRLLKESEKTDVPDFSNGLTKGVRKKLHHVIDSARDGTLFTGLFYEYFVEKINQCFQKHSVKDFTEIFY